MAHRDKSLTPWITNGYQKHEPDVEKLTATELGTRLHQEIERQRAMWGTADELFDPMGGTFNTEPGAQTEHFNEEPLITGHYHVGDAHIAQGAAELNRQLLAYAHLTDASALIVSGGDYLHERGPVGPDVVVVIDDDVYHLDYKLAEERILQFMHGEDVNLHDVYRDRHALQSMQYLSKALDRAAEPKVVKPKAGRSKDWEQRNRKQRR